MKPNAWSKAWGKSWANSWGGVRSAAVGGSDDWVPIRRMPKPWIDAQKDRLMAQDEVLLLLAGALAARNVW